MHLISYIPFILFIFSKHSQDDEVFRGFFLLLFFLFQELSKLQLKHNKLN